MQDDLPMQLARLLDTVPLYPFVHEQFGAFLNHEGDKVRSSVRSTAQQHMRIFASEKVQRGAGAA